MDGSAQGLAAEREGLPPDAPDAIIAAANGGSVTAGEERGALDWLLGKTQRLQYTIPVDYETPGGMMKLQVRIQQMDDRRLNELDSENRDGDGPFAKLDTTGFNVAVCAEAMLWVEDEGGRRVEVASPEWIGAAPTPLIAMEARFKYQPGILAGIVEEVKRTSGYSTNRVGSAQRVLVSAVGGS